MKQSRDQRLDFGSRVDDMSEDGVWWAVIGVAGALSWRVLQYLRQPTFVSRARLDEVIETASELRVKASALRSENSELRSQIKRHMAECEFWQDEYRKLKASIQHGARGK